MPLLLIARSTELGSSIAPVSSLSVSELNSTVLDDLILLSEQAGIDLGTKLAINSAINRVLPRYVSISLPVEDTPHQHPLDQ